MEEQEKLPPPALLSMNEIAKLRSQNTVTYPSMSKPPADVQMNAPDKYQQDL